MRRALTLLACASCVLVLTAFRCPGPDPLTDSNRATGGGGTGGGVGPGPGGNGGDGGDGGECPPTPLDQDDDGDGYSENDGDCNDCDPAVSPGAAELPTLSDDEPVDDDCDGELDEEPACEPAANATGVTPEAAARAIELCDDAGETGWGLENARLVNANSVSIDGSSPQVAVTSQFGTALHPQMGGRMLVLSTGHAADADDPGACTNQSCGNDNSGKGTLPGYPIGLPGCPISDTIFDDVALEVTVKPPPNAAGFSFYSAYLTHEYAESVCSAFEDQFLALVTPKSSGTMLTNVIFDQMGIPPSASFTPFPHCDPTAMGAWAEICAEGPACPPEPSLLCGAGPALLAGTGFAPFLSPNMELVPGGATTGWLKTYVPLEGDEPLEISFLIFDTGDWTSDSTVLIDGFRWLGPTDQLGAEPVTVLK